MKKSFLLAVVFSVVMAVNQLVAQTVEVIDFHSTHRCRTCVGIEKSTKAVLEKEFADELKSGKIVFKTVNVDDAQNAKLAAQFEASGTALWIYRADKKIKVDLTDFAFMNMRDAEKFSERIKTEVAKALK